MSDKRNVYLGLMSGTSLDGISAAAVRFHDREGRLQAELVGYVTLPYDAARREPLRAALPGAPAAAYNRLAFDLGGWFAEAAIAVIAESGVPRSEVRAIGS